ncbi:hypothetical protein CABS02_13971 [Colletotrichum abscissum]|uniref:Uncharacterized protein n=1 Tax=Colletotrichum abscissum TaxID=1671311 RepID=A0A9Q0AYP6_9PEZI|nr:hypothetical protein CABS02_13971 [Colletotrichum abscissum]
MDASQYTTTGISTTSGLYPPPPDLRRPASDEPQSPPRSHFRDSQHARLLTRHAAVPASAAEASRSVPAHGPASPPLQVYDAQSNSLTRLCDGSTIDEKDLTNSAIGASERGGKMQHCPMAPGQDEKVSNGELNPEQRPSFDGAQIYQAGAQRAYEDHTQSPLSSAAHTLNLTDLVPSTSVQNSRRSPGTSPDSPDHLVSLFYLIWNVPPSIRDPFTLLSNRILSFLFPPGSQTINEHTGFNLYFSPQNIREFLLSCTHIHSYSPFIHTPALRIMDAYPGLLVAMCCLGACNSDFLPPDHVRDMVNTFTSARVRDQLSLDDSTGKQKSDHVGAGYPSQDEWDPEKAQAAVLLDNLMKSKTVRQHASLATTKYLGYISQLDVSTGMPFPHHCDGGKAPPPQLRY